MAKSRGKAKRFISLFSGCGGFDLGFQNRGWQCLGAYDNEPLAIATYRNNLGDHGRIRDLSVGLSLPSELEKPELVIGGPPCQGFSVQGKRAQDDPRNNLLLSAGKIAVAIKPKVIAIENVAGVTLGEHKKYWDKLRAIFVSAGYQSLDIKFDAEKLGLPQLRKRMVMIAWNSGKDVHYRPEENGKTSLKEAIGMIGNADNHAKKILDPSSNQGKIAKRIKQGQKLCNVRNGPKVVHSWHIPEVYGSTNEKERKILEKLLIIRRTRRVRDFGDADPVPTSILQKEFSFDISSMLISLLRKGYLRKFNRNYDLTNTFNGKYKRLEWDNPSFTVDTRFGDPTCFLHPEENRGFTVREAARIQGFPDSFIFAGPERAQFRMVGNAVPPPLAEIIANWINDALMS